MSNKTGFTWTFHRIGGLDQVVLLSAEELKNLDKLDPKLWTVLSCPSSGLEFDSRTLTLIDTDKDGRIRIPEVKAAVTWACERLKDPGEIINPLSAMPLSAINNETEDGKRLLLTAHTVLENLGKKDCQELTQEDASLAASGAVQHLFNGDGIVPPLESLDEDVREFITNAISVVGGLTDTGGETGINQEIADAFVSLMKDWMSWRDNVDHASSPLGNNTPQAWELLQEIKDKVDDFFLRTQLASYAPQSATFLNPGENEITSGEHGILNHEILEDLPLAHVQAGGFLSRTSGVNPAWRVRIEQLFAFTEPVLEDKNRISFEDWQKLQGIFEDYKLALESKPAVPDVEITTLPVSSVDSLGIDKVKVILESGVYERFSTIAKHDAESPAAASDIIDIERLVLYYLHLHTLLMNFVSFHDFYASHKKASFQSGTLFIDSRACHLCVPVTDVDKHAVMANYSRLFLIYCSCQRVVKTGTDADNKTIVAAVTDGSGDTLMEGRNGVFVDNEGNDWDTTIIKIINNPINLREAVWDPYRRIGRLVGEQVTKFAGSKRKEVLDSAGKKIGDATSSVQAAADTSTKFDIGKSVGIFAAIGLALGALGTALASITSALLSLAWWQFPLVFIAIFLLISGPSVFLAWLKLRQRNLGPLLEASGWAINGMIKVNYNVGVNLTDTAVLPPNAKRSYRDPLTPPKRWPWVVLFIAIVAGSFATYWLWNNPPAFVQGLFADKPAVTENAPDAAAPSPAQNATEKVEAETAPVPAQTNATTQN